MNSRLSVGGAMACSLRVRRRATLVRKTSLGLSSAKVLNTCLRGICFKNETRSAEALQALLNNNDAIL